MTFCNSSLNELRRLLIRIEEKFEVEIYFCGDEFLILGY